MPSSAQSDKHKMTKLNDNTVLMRDGDAEYVEISILTGIGKGEKILLDYADYPKFAHCTNKFFKQHNGKGGYYARVYDTSATGNQLTPARILLGVGGGKTVRYLNANGLDLRRMNLGMQAGRAKRADAWLADYSMMAKAGFPDDDA